MNPSPAELGFELLSVVSSLNRWATQQAPLALPTAQARLLSQVAELGDARICDLARADHCSQPTMTAHVQRVEACGWVQRTRDRLDGRAVLISLTEEGRRVLLQARRQRAEVLAPHLARMTPADRRRMADAIDVMRQLVPAPVRASA